jgi:hypothetical protein
LNGVYGEGMMMIHQWMVGEEWEVELKEVGGMGIGLREF